MNPAGKKEGVAPNTPSLAVDNAAEAIEFYKRAFGGDSVLMLFDPFPQATVKPRKQVGGTSVGIFLYVEDVDEVMG